MFSALAMKIVVLLITGFCLAIGFGYGNKAYAAIDRTSAKVVETVKARRFAKRHDMTREERPSWATPGESFFAKLGGSNYSKQPV